ncbi:TPA: hypothetical protein N0X11_004945, partial [Enterobacter roggenkampii]|nr:hypothetical protein [Enterobacter roggenkampii]
GLVHLVMNRLIGNLFTDFFQLADGGVTRIAASGFHLLVGRFRGRNLAVSARNIRNLIADLANHLRGLQAFLLFLFVKDRVDAAVGMVSVTAERADVLLLVSLVANNDSTVGYR